MTCRDYCKDLGPQGYYKTIEKHGRPSLSHINLHALESFKAKANYFENLTYGHKNGLAVILSLLCSNGDKNRTQRKIMQDATLGYLGSHSDNHKISQVMTVINYCQVDIDLQKSK